MYKLINSETNELVGVVQRPVFIRRKEESGALIQTTDKDAQGIAFKSKAYNLLGRDGVGVDETVALWDIDLGDYIAEAKEGVENSLFPVENAETASQPYVKGKYFYHNGRFCKAKTSIPRGARFTLNTNYEVKTLSTELFNLFNS